MGIKYKNNRSRHGAWHFKKIPYEIRYDVLFASDLIYSLEQLLWVNYVCLQLFFPIFSSLYSNAAFHIEIVQLNVVLLLLLRYILPM